MATCLHGRLTETVGGQGFEAGLCGLPIGGLSLDFRLSVGVQQTSTVEGTYDEPVACLKSPIDAVSIWSLLRGMEDVEGRGGKKGYLQQ